VGCRGRWGVARWGGGEVGCRGRWGDLACCLLHERLLPFVWAPVAFCM